MNHSFKTFSNKNMQFLSQHIINLQFHWFFITMEQEIQNCNIDSNVYLGQYYWYRIIDKRLRELFLYVALIAADVNFNDNKSSKSQIHVCVKSRLNKKWHRNRNTNSTEIAQNSSK